MTPEVTFWFSKLNNMIQLRSAIKLLRQGFIFLFFALVTVFYLVFLGPSFMLEAGQVSFSVQPGDLLFQDLNGDSFFEAVAKVTQGYSGAVLTHVGIAAYNAEGETIVLEALQEGVVATPLEIFLNRSFDQEGNPKVLVGRLKRQYQHLVDSALAEAFARKGKPYNHLFDIENRKAYYCSEFIYVCFREANQGVPLFELEPMTFVDPDTQEIFPVWKNYFEGLEAEVPEGEPGLNPGGISRSPVLEVIHNYGVPIDMCNKESY